MEENRISFIAICVNIVGKRLFCKVSKANLILNNRIYIHISISVLFNIAILLCERTALLQYYPIPSSTFRETYNRFCKLRELGQYKLMAQALPWRAPKNILFLTPFHLNRAENKKEIQCLAEKYCPGYNRLVLFHIGERELAFVLKESILNAG